MEDTGSTEGATKQALNAAAEILATATQTDKEGNFRAAFDQYMRGIRALLNILKTNVHSALANEIRSRCRTYLQRTESLKTWLEESKHISRNTMSSEVTHESDKPAVLERYLVRESTAFSDIAGLEDAKMILKEQIVLPFLFPLLFKGARKPSRCICMYGPTGIGKTSLAKALTGELSKTFSHVATTELKLYHMSTRTLLQDYSSLRLRELREMFRELRRTEGNVLILDDFEQLDCRELDGSLRQQYRQIYTELLVQLSGLNDTDVTCCCVIILLTNPWEMSWQSLAKRCGAITFVPMPDFKARLELLNKHLLKESCDFSADDVCELALLTHRLSGADIEKVCMQVNASCTKDSESYWKCVCETVKQYEPSVSVEQVEKYEHYAMEHNRHYYNGYRPPELRHGDTVHSLQDRCCDVIVDALEVGSAVEPCDLVDIKLPLPRTMRLLLAQRTMQRLGRW